MSGIRKALTDLETNSITSLDLKYNIRDDDVCTFADVLLKNTSLTSLCLSRNNFGNKSIKALADALVKNTSLTSLDLSWNGISDDGVRALADVLLKNTSLTSLDLSGNNIRDRGTRALADMLIQNTSLTSMDFDSYFDTNDNTYDNTITALLKRNNNYVKCKLSMDMFFNVSDMPNELHSIVNSCVLPLCLD